MSKFDIVLLKLKDPNLLWWTPLYGIDPIATVTDAGYKLWTPGSGPFQECNALVLVQQGVPVLTSLVRAIAWLQSRGIYNWHVREGLTVEDAIEIGLAILEESEEGTIIGYNKVGKQVPIFGSGHCQVCGSCGYPECCGVSLCKYLAEHQEANSSEGEVPNGD